MPPLWRFPVRHRGATGHLFLSFLLLFSCPSFSSSQQFLNSPSFHISSSESLLTNPPHPLLHTSKPTAVFCQHLATLAGGLWLKRLYLHNCLDWSCTFLKFYGGVLNGICGALRYKTGRLQLLHSALLMVGHFIFLLVRKLSFPLQPESRGSNPDPAEEAELRTHQSLASRNPVQQPKASSASSSMYEFLRCSCKNLSSTTIHCILHCVGNIAAEPKVGTVLVMASLPPAVWVRGHNQQSRQGK